MLARDKVILVNERDEWINTASKADAHRSGALHRALSIFIINDAGELLLQRRAADKYHSGGLWSNACCTHPAPGESTTAAAHRRLREELGFDTELARIGAFIYYAPLPGGLIEHEYDHIFTGIWTGPVLPDPGEVSETRWIQPDALDAWLVADSGAFSAWFPLVLRYWNEHATTAFPQLRSVGAHVTAH